jgi:EmrB/QacA subfamily drug resistance transporter
LSTQTADRALLWIVAAGFFMQTLDTTIVNTALPSMARTLNESPLQMQPVVVAYTLTMAMLTPASGWLADRFGNRATYLGSILLFAIGSALCAGAQSLPQLVAARVLQALGGSMLLPIGRLTIMRNFKADQYIAVLATVSIAGQCGPLLGPTLGGWMVQVVSWHWIFLINLPIGAIGLWAVYRFMPQGRLESAPRFDLLGFALVSLCMLAWSLALDVPAHTHRTAWSIGLIGAGFAAVIAYLVHAQRRKSPLFRLGIFMEPNMSVGLLGNLFARIGSSAVPFLLPLLMQVQLGYSPLRSGLMMVPTAVAGIMTKSWISGLVRRYGYVNFLMVNTLVVGGSIASFALISNDWPVWLQILQLAIFGGANSMQFAAMNSVTLKDLSVEDAGSGNSLFSMVQMLALGLGATIGGGLVNLLSPQLESTALAFRFTFMAVGGITLLSALIFRRLRSVPGQRTATSPS